MRTILAVVTGLALLVTPTYAKAQHYPPNPKLLQEGKRLYARYCEGCHAKNGNGRGKSAKELDIHCRDFTQAVFKFRSTPSGYLPTDEDLYRTITHGIRLSTDSPRNMRSFKDLSPEKRWALVDYIKTFSDRWQDPEDHAAPIVIPNRPPATQERIDLGRQVWGKVRCAQCHGPGGKGNGPSAEGLKDRRGNPIPPADFTNLALLKGGHRPQDIYRTFTTGLDGTPMPSYGDTLTNDQRWDLVYYVLSLGLGERGVIERYGH